MEPATRPSDVAEHIAADLDDNLHVPVPTLLQFELVLANFPTDQTARRAYHDWLLEHGCVRRAEQLARELEDREPGEYAGPVRPAGGYDWAGL